MEDLYGRYDYFLLELYSLEIFFLREMVAKVSLFLKSSTGFSDHVMLLNFHREKRMMLLNIYLLP